MEEKLRRQFIVSYLPAVTKLNISAVSPEERTTAERMFLRHYAEKEEKPDRLVLYSLISDNHSAVTYFLAYNYMMKLIPFKHKYIPLKI